jgi:Family of unknown function (DUF6101)
MTGATPRAGAVSLQGSGPGSIPTSAGFNASDLPALVSAGIRGAVRPAGVALRLEGAGDTESFAIAIVDLHGVTLIPLGRFAEEDVVAEWRALGASSGLPLLIERADGSFDLPYPQIGRVRLGEFRIRRRHGLLNGRRPRFLTRRKTGRLPLRPAVHREREITSRKV